MLDNARPADWISLFIKRFIYTQLGVFDAAKILVGRHKPTLTFRILGDPCSVYINFEVREEMQDEFTRYINLAQGLALAPVSCIDGEEPALTLTLNIYEVSGLVSGARAEWSTYIVDPDGQPRYMVLEAQSAKGSMDPVNIVTRRGHVTHARSGEFLESEATALDGENFRSRLRLDDSQDPVRLDPRWIAANDYIYWRNGVFDRAWYNGSLFNATVRAVPGTDVELDDQTHWARFVKAQPRHVLRYEDGLDMMVSPWYNV